MARVKFLVFALAVLLLWVAHLALLSPPLAAAAVDQASRQAAAAPISLSRITLERRAALQQLGLKFASSGPVFNAFKVAAKPEVPTAEKLLAVRAALAGAIAEDLRKQLVVGLVTEAGGIYARGEGEPVVATEELDVAAMARGDFSIQPAFGALHAFVSAPVSVPDKVESKQHGSLVLGAPLLPDGSAEAIASELKLEGVAVGTREATAAMAGPLAKAAEQALKTGKPGQVGPAQPGSVSVFGPFGLPMLTHGDLFGGGGATAVSSRLAVPGSPLEVVAIASTAPMLRALADYQKTALMLLLGLLLFSLAWAFLMVPANEAPSMVVQQRPLPGSPGGHRRTGDNETLPGTMSTPPPAPAEASPEDFQFGGGVPSDGSAGDNDFSGAMPPAPSEMPYEGQEGEGAQLAPPPFGDSDDEQTMAYPTHLEPALGAVDPQDFNPEATRVAAIPRELLQASARNEPSAESGRGSELPSMPSVSAGNGSTDDAHYQDVYQSFLTTREQCGEPGDGLTYEKFAQKLRKNREQLIQKYSCKTVRFQVYVKEGKAALKATPVKD